MHARRRADSVPVTVLLWCRCCRSARSSSGVPALSSTRASNCSPSSETIRPAITERQADRGQVDLAAGQRQAAAGDRRAGQPDPQPAAYAAA